LKSRLKDAKRVVIVGNGGIALEIVHALKRVEIIWVVKHGHIGDAFFDVDAAQFLLEELYREQDIGMSSKDEKKKENSGGDKTSNAPDYNAQVEHSQQQQQQLQKQEKEVVVITERMLGHAVGPRWASSLQSTTSSPSSSPNHIPLPAHVTIESQAEIASIAYTAIDEDDTTTPHYHRSILDIKLTNGAKYKADLVISAIGVDPAVDWVDGTVKRDVDRSNGGDGGLVVGPDMQTSIAGIYAAGDAASIHFPPDNNDDENDYNDSGSQTMPRTWFQMRLWPQARSAGIHAAHSMAGVADETASDMAFELFTHATRFLGKRVILLGLYNGQGLGDEDAADMVSYSRIGSSDDGHHGGGCCGKHTPTNIRIGNRDKEHHDERTFVRILLLKGRVIGAVLIGETGLEEALENLILDRLDVGVYGPSLLDPDFELDHVFD
jgi:pyridine nucleotide-disulfide oxidoreductase domain-containing protein 1